MLKLADSSGSSNSELDGFPIPLSQEAFERRESGEHVNVEFWGHAIPEGKYGKIGDDKLPNIGNGLETPATAVRNNTYKALRVMGEGYNLLYVVWCFGERELYDLTVSQPYFLTNIQNADDSF